jgi:HK97 family phage major capsid protein
MSDDIKDLLIEQKKTFEAFKAANDDRDAQIKKLGAADTVTADKVEKIDAELTALADRIKAAVTDAEKKAGERVEDVERKLADLEKAYGRLQAQGQGGPGASGEIDVKTFNAHRESRGLRGSVDADEAKAYNDAFLAHLRKGDPHTDAERKAMSVGSDPDGGYLVTPNISGRMIVRVYETSEMRAYADSQTIGTDAMEGSKDINDASAGWVGESDARVVSSTPQLGVWRIPVHEMYAMPDATQKALDDANMDIEAWLAAKTGSKFGRMENTAFVAGSGNLQPRGFTTYTTAATADASRAWGTFEHIVTGASGAFVSGVTQADCLLNTVGALKAAYLPNARWFLKRLTLTDVRKLKDTTGQYLWQPSLMKDAPDTLLGFPVVRMEDMPAVGAGSLSIAFGDMRQTYQIVDRAGVRVLRDPYTAKPYVRFYTTRRVGGDVLHFESMKFVKFST